MLTFLRSLLCFQPGDVDLQVEVADVADDGVVGHLLHVPAEDDVAAAGGGDEDVAPRGGLVHRRHLEALHRRLQGADRIDLGDQHPRAVGPHRMGTALAHVAVAADDHDLAGDHDVGRPLDAVGQRLAAAVEVVELALGDRVVDVDGGDGQLAALVHLVEAVYAGGGLFRQAADAGQQVAILRAVDHGRQVAAVVDDQVQRLRRRGSTSVCSMHQSYSASVSPFQA